MLDFAIHQTTHPAARPWRGFRSHFEDNAQRPYPALPPPAAPTIGAASLAAILARFQLGEAGEGRIAHEIDRVAVCGVDADYRVALKLFVKEEGRHARILGAMVKSLGGKILQAKASNHLFRHARRFLGVRFKVSVLLVAEVVGGVLYDVLEKSLQEPSARAALRQIAGDERAHLAFHAAFLAAQPGRWRVPLRLGFWLVGMAASAVVITENFRDLLRLGFPPHAITVRLLRGLRAADRRTFGETAADLIDNRENLAGELS
jgi:hypothetical protein